MVETPRQESGRVARLYRTTYAFLGFSKGYNFALFFVFAGALFGFGLARLEYFNYNGIFCGTNGGGNGAGPGECYYYARDHYKIGMMLHLFTVIPASLLAVFQFVPAIRHRFIIFHKLNGYLCILLILTGTVGALMIARISFGGSLETQAAVGFLSILVVVSFILSYVNIKRLQIDQHRAWMLRAWFYLGTIITTRIVMIISAQIISRLGGFYTSRPCAQIAYIYKNAVEPTLALYPECASYFDGTNTDQQAVVLANFGNRPDQIGASLGVSFGMALWLAIAIHAIGVEVYLNLTPRESDRLRRVSYQRQLEAGYKCPGSAGLTIERFGDAEPWKPSVIDEK